MIARRRLLACAAAALVAGAARADEPLLDRISRRLAAAAVLRGRFEQRKTLKGFRHPLVSSGDFVVAKGRGVLWHTRAPLESMLVVSRERLLLRRADGRVDGGMDAAVEPALIAVNETLFALMATDFTALAQRFRIDGELLAAQGWRVVLLPDEPAFARWLTRIELEGDRHLRRARLFEAQGDMSEIRFSDYSVADALTADEAARFD